MLLVLGGGVLGVLGLLGGGGVGVVETGDVAVAVGDTSGMPVRRAQTPRAVPKCGVKQWSNRSPSVARARKTGVVSTGLSQREVL